MGTDTIINKRPLEMGCMGKLTDLDFSDHDVTIFLGLNCLTPTNQQDVGRNHHNMLRSESWPSGEDF